MRVGGVVGKETMCGLPPLPFLLRSSSFEEQVGLCRTRRPLFLLAGCLLLAACAHGGGGQFSVLGCNPSQRGWFCGRPRIDSRQPATSFLRLHPAAYIL